MHQSFSFENKIKKNYQRLEFLGDSILNFLVSDFLFVNYPKMTEGKMSIIKSNLVKGENLSKITFDIGLYKYIKIANNQNINLKNNSKLFSDIFESILSAIYLDIGLWAVRKFLLQNLFKNLKNLDKMEFKNPKTLLQEYLQIESRENIEYVTTKNEDGTFYTEVFHEKNKFGIGSGQTKKEAEINAAKNALNTLEINK